MDAAGPMAWMFFETAKRGCWDQTKHPHDPKKLVSLTPRAAARSLSGLSDGSDMIQSFVMVAKTPWRIAAATL